MQSADEPVREAQDSVPQTKELPPKAPEKVDVKPSARDDEIKRRLLGILNATKWFSNPNIEVKEGVVFLQGTTSSNEFKLWAGNLAANTQDVSAVVNKIKVTEPSMWNFEPIIFGLKEQWRDLARILPSLISALLIFILTLAIARAAAALARKGLASRIPNSLLRDVTARAIAIFVLLIGLYVIFKLLGLTTIALTILGGTGVLGLILGIAFKDITENLLASIFLSVHRPFQNGDFVEIDGISGYVQKLTSRSTFLLTPNGNYVEVPNATVFKTKIHNNTVNPNKRITFTIPISPKEDISKMQEIALQVLENHPAVLKDPEPWVLVDNIERSKVTLCVYFWINTQEHSTLKIKSSVIRLVSYAFDKEKILKEGTRETLRIIRKPAEDGQVQEAAPLATESEEGFRSESEEIKEQARLSRTPEKEEKNLLDSNGTP